MKAFEIQTYQGGRWKIDSIFDDRALALFEARRLEDTFRFPSIRVVEEDYNEASNETVSKTIFRSGKANRKILAQEEAPRKAAQQGNGADRGRARGKIRQTKKTNSSVTGPVIVLVVAVIAGVAAMFGLQMIK